MVLISNAPLGAAQLECLPCPRFSALLGAPPGLALGEIRLPVKQRQALQAILMQGTFSSCSDPTAIFTKTPEKSQEEEMKAMSPNAFRGSDEATLVCGTSELGAREPFQ